MSPTKSKTKKSKLSKPAKVSKSSTVKSRSASSKKSSSKKENAKGISYKLLSGILAVLLVISLIFNFNIANTAGVNPFASVDIFSASDLNLWKDESRLKTELEEYMIDITNPNSENFIPVKDRIAVFDFDGTLFCETDPVYIDHRLMYYRVMEDPNYKNKATAFEKNVAMQVKNFMDTGAYPETLNVDHGKVVASSFKGMTPDEFSKYVLDYANKPAPSYNMNNIDGYYKPMVQVVKYLQKNKFKVYVVSGTDRLILRPVVEKGLGLPASQIIGSDQSFVATNQKGQDGLTYQFKKNDEVVLGGDFIIKNLKMNKVSVIEREIGAKPVLSFGNSSGDYSMANFVITNNKYPSLAFMLCCDDLDRENGNKKKAEDMYNACEENGWVPISMKNDWTTIYGDNVVYKK